MTADTAVAPRIIPAAHNWNTNADLIADVAALGYIRPEDTVLDMTWGKGGFWKKFSPAVLLRHDLYTLDGVDFRDLPQADNWFDVVVFDPDYKFVGTPSLTDFDERYGTDKAKRWQDRMEDLRLGVVEGCRVTAVKGRLLVKCQDQVVSGDLRWQTDLVTDTAKALGFVKEDEFLMLGGGIPQTMNPKPGADGQPRKARKQKHAHGRGSTLLVFRKKHHVGPTAYRNERFNKVYPGARVEAGDNDEADTQV